MYVLCYNAKHKGDLTFRKGQKLQIVEKNDPECGQSNG